MAASIREYCSAVHLRIKLRQEASKFGQVPCVAGSEPHLGTRKLIWRNGSEGNDDFAVVALAERAPLRALFRRLKVPS